MLKFSRSHNVHIQSKERLGNVTVVPDPLRCMQCGICSFNCPAGIDVRSYAWQGLPVDDSVCLACGECVRRCPRRGLRFEPIYVAGKARN